MKGFPTGNKIITVIKVLNCIWTSIYDIFKRDLCAHLRIQKRNNPARHKNYHCRTRRNEIQYYLYAVRPKGKLPQTSNSNGYTQRERTILDNYTN